jgi:hypothetical protein
LDARGRVNYALSKEVERIHLGIYSKDYLLSAYKKDVECILLLKGTLQEQKEHHNYLNALAKISTCLQEDAQFLLKEAEKRVCSQSDQESVKQLTAARMVPADCICASTTGERVWVEVGKETVQSYVAWLLGGSNRNEQQGGQATKKSAPINKMLSSGARRDQHAVIFANGPPLLLLSLAAKRRASNNK